MQYTIEARELTHQTFGPGPRRTTVEAGDADEAISRFVHDNQSELVSFTKSAGLESIATVRKDEAVFLVRVYTD